MARMRERAFAWFGAILFALSAVSLTVAVIVQEVITHHESSQPPSATSQVKSKESTLQGKELANFTPISQVDQLQIIDIKEGTGAAAKASDTITIDYTGALAATGVIFQSSLDTGQPVTLSLNQLIDGWKQGILGMKVGGQRRLLIPAAQAYGAHPRPGSGIPPNASLVFDITLHGIGS